MTLTAKAIAAIILLSVAVLVPLEIKTKSVAAASSEIKTKVAETISTRKKITGLTVQISRMKESLSAYDATCRKLAGIQWVKALQVISDTVPNRIRIVDISTTESGQLTITGESRTEKDIYIFEKKLRDSKFFETAKVEKIEYEDRSSENIITYNIICRVRPQENNL